MKIYNKNNFRIISLIKKPHYRYAHKLHVTKDFTEVTDGHFLMRVASKEIKIEELPGSENASTPLNKNKTCLLSVKMALRILKLIPRNKKVPAIQHSWFGKKTTTKCTELIATDLETWHSLTEIPGDEE